MENEKIKALYEHIKALHSLVETLQCQLDALHLALLTDRSDLEARYQSALYENYHNSQNNAVRELAHRLDAIE